MPDRRRRAGGSCGGGAVLVCALALAACSGKPPPPPLTTFCTDGLVPSGLSSRPPAAGTDPASASRWRAASRRDPVTVVNARDLADLKRCLDVEKTRAEIRKLDVEVRNAVRDLSTPGIINIVLQYFAILAALFGASAALWRYFEEKRKTREEAQNMRFEGIVAALGSEVPAARIGAAALLATFLERGYDRFYVSVFKLTVGYLVPDETARSSDRATRRRMVRRSREDRSKPVDPLDQMFASVLKTAYPLALAWLVRERDRQQAGPLLRLFRPGAIAGLSPGGVWSSDGFVARLKRQDKLLFAKEQASRTLDAENIALDGAYLAGAAFPCGWFRKATFSGIDGTGINFAQARLSGAVFIGAQLKDAQFAGAVLDKADFTDARLDHAGFEDSDLTRANFTGARLGRTNFIGATLDHADFTGANFTVAEGELESTIEEALSLKGANLRGVIGLAGWQIERCVDKGALP